MYKAIISVVMILVMSASLGSGAPAELEVIVDEIVAAPMPKKQSLGVLLASAHQWQLVSAEVGGEYCDL